ncbi:ribonuclease P protein component [Candidatus Gracilibacteria bacterium]|nr:ribonuclease P protein component [Candidatus Gracilibacteria bacterium]
MKEREVKKVLQKGKPFFSYNIVFNRVPNRLGYSRFAIVVSGKSAKNAVIRNVYRRMYYEACRPYIQKNLGDIACVVKTKTKLTGDSDDIHKIHSEILYLFDKKLGKNT